MYSLQNMDSSLSLIQLSVAFNLGSILVNQISKLFNSERKEFKIQWGDMEEVVLKFFKEPKRPIDETMKDVQKLTAAYLNCKNLNDQIAIYKLNFPICFPYACMLLGVWGVVGLYTIPLVKESGMMLNMLIYNSFFSILCLIGMIVLEISFRMRADWAVRFVVNKLNSHFIILFIVALAFITIIIAIIAYLFRNYYWLEPYLSCLLNFFIILPFLSFVKCFLFNLYDEYKFNKTNEELKSTSETIDALLSKVQKDKKGNDEE